MAVESCGGVVRPSTWWALIGLAIVNWLDTVIEPAPGARAGLINTIRRYAGFSLAPSYTRVEWDPLEGSLAGVIPASSFIVAISQHRAMACSKSGLGQDGSQMPLLSQEETCVCLVIHRPNCVGDGESETSNEIRRHSWETRENC